MKIVVDAMGSDNYPDPEIRGAILAVEQFGIEVILVGDEELVEPRLQAAISKIYPFPSIMLQIWWK
jgi:glycerol-3-phosphate acyltransferase PlsX